MPVLPRSHSGDSTSTQSLLNTVRIVLVEPAGPLNLGSIARVMKNMGLSQLVLVNPRCDRHQEEAVRMAVHASDVLESARQVNSLEEALLDCRGIAGTVGRTQPMDFELGVPRTEIPNLLAPRNQPCALVFGPEDRGLNNRELGMCQRKIAIPTSPVYPSMNLAQAVGICVYELRQAAISLRQEDDRSSKTNRSEKKHLLVETSASVKRAPSQVVEGFYGHLEQVLLTIGFLYPHTAPRKLLKFRKLFDRAQLSLQDVALLRGVLRQLAWANHNLKPQSPPLNSCNGAEQKVSKNK